MPTYDFKCNNCEEVFTVLCKISEMKEQHCPKCDSHSYETYFASGSLNLIDPVRLGVRTIDDGFREVLSKINQNNYKSNLGDKLSRS